MWRRNVLAATLFLLLVASSVRPELLRLLRPPHRLPHVRGPELGIDRRPLRLRDDSTPDELRVFLAMLRLQIPKGSRVSIVLPPPHDGFSYEYWRASYELAGRDVTLPPSVADPASARFVATWQTEWAHPAYAIVWSGFGGALLERR